MTASSLSRAVVERRLEPFGLHLPRVLATPRGSYAVVRSDGDVAHTSALGPFALDGNGGFTHIGEVGTDLSEGAARAAAAVTAVHLIAAVDQTVGIAAVARILELIVYVRAHSRFENHATVADGASEVLLAAFGPIVGAHARTVVGVHTLPFGLPLVASMKLRLHRGGGS